MHGITLPIKTMLTLRNRTRSFRIPERLQAELFRVLVFLLLVASAVPAVNALRDPQPYVTYQNFIDRLMNKTVSVPLSAPYAHTGVRIEALTKLIACGFVLVLMWKGAHRRPVQAMILFIELQSVSADPVLAGFLERQPNAGAVSPLWVLEVVQALVAASLLRFAVLFPRPLTTTELLSRLSGAHLGMLRRALRNVITVGRSHLPRTPFLQVSAPDAVVLLALASVAAVTRVAAWPWMLNRFLAGAAIVFVTVRLGATLRRAIQASRRGPPIAAFFQIGLVLVAMAAIALFIQRDHPLVDGVARLALLAFLIGGGTRILSRLPSISWFDAVIVLALATLMFLTTWSSWTWSRHSQLAALAALIVITRLAATALSLWIRKGQREHFSREPLAGPLLIAVYALAVFTHPSWVSPRPVELLIVLVTMAWLAWMLGRKLRSHLPLSDLQVRLARPVPVWSAALVGYFVTIASVVSIATLKRSVDQVSPVGALAALGAAACGIGLLLVAAMVGGFLLLAIKFLRIGYEVGNARERQQVLWIVEGVAVVAAIELVTELAPVVLSGVVPPDVTELGRRLSRSVHLPVILLSFGVAIFYHGALDPGLIIRRTTVYLAVFVVSVFLFEGMQNAISGIFSPLLTTLKLPRWFASTISAGIVAFAFMPIRRLCDALVARHIPIVFSDAVEAEPTRRTAVIVMTDLVGYSATTLDDERGASTQVALLRHVVKEVAAAAGGRVIEWRGDLALLEFADTARAVMACRQVFERFQRAGDSLGLSHAPLRASVHVGDLLLAADGGVTGRAVIIANRLRECASAGEILLSRTAMAGLPHVLRNAVENLGPTTLSDVPEPHQCFRMQVP